MKYLFIFISFLFLTACKENNEKAEHKTPTEIAHDQDEEGHSHEAPNGGVLTEVGGHSASVEWLIEDGQFKLFIFDGHRFAIDSECQPHGIAYQL